VIQGHVNTHSGPLPPAELLAAYEEVYPGAAQLMFEDFRERSAHNRDLEKKLVHADIARANRAPLFSIVVLLAAIGSGTWLGHFEHTAAAIAAFGVAGTSAATIFITGVRAKQKQDAAEKDSVNRSAAVTVHQEDRQG